MPEIDLFDLIQRLKKRCLQAEEEERRASGLLAAELVGLTSFRPAETISCRELGQRMGLSPSRTSRIVDSLCGKGLVSRTGTGTDRRCRLLRPTSRGLEVLGRISLGRERCRRRLVAGLTKTEVERLMKNLSRLAERF